MGDSVWPGHVMSLYKSGDYSDLAIECQGHVFKVHKAIVCPQSPVIAAAINGSFEEARTNHILTEQFEKDIVEAMILFMYGEKTGVLKEDWPPLKEDAATDTEDLATTDKVVAENASKTSTDDEIQLGLRQLIQINGIADYYNISSLCSYTRRRIGRVLGPNWTPARFFDAAEFIPKTTGHAELHHAFARYAANRMESIVAHNDKFASLTSLKDFTAQYMEVIGQRLIEVVFDISLCVRTVGELHQSVKSKDVEIALKDGHITRNEAEISRLNSVVRQLQRGVDVDSKAVADIQVLVKSCNGVYGTNYRDIYDKICARLKQRDSERGN